MNRTLRVVLTVVTTVAVFFYVSIIAMVFLDSWHLPAMLTSALAIIAAILSARYVWRYTLSVPVGLVNSLVLGALLCGGVAFVAGFIGPMILAPHANQGPMLGIFITGPLGFVLGAVGGVLYWITRGREHRRG